jgi:ABC-2 type transport system ATP-binding protein
LIEELDTQKLEKLRARHLEVQVRNIEAAQICLQSAGYKYTLKDETIILNDAHSLSRPDYIAHILVNAGVAPTRLAIEQQNLEEHFLQLTGGAQ